MNSYTIRYVKNRDAFQQQLADGAWAPIAHFPWECPGHPKAEAMLCYDAEGFWVALRAWEDPIRAEVTCQNGPVYTDSCLEFFLAPAPHVDQTYINFECNPCGYMLVEVGPSKTQRTLQRDIDTRSLFAIEALERIEDFTNGMWQLVYHIPFHFIASRIPAFAAEAKLPMRGNFYKCGDACEAPHWACWNPIDLPRPMFHCPDHFGALVWDKEGN